MNTFMSDQITDLRETLNEKLLVTYLRETLLAFFILAYVRAQLIMDSLMFLQRRILSKRGIANWAILNIILLLM